jgi:hypothetical protein
MSRRRGAAFAIVALSCAVDDGVLGGVRSSGGNAGADGGAASGSAAQCREPGPLVTLSDRSGTASYSACTGRLAAASFLNAVCSCGDAHFGNFLRTRGFDSSRGAYEPGQADDSGASVGVNGTYALAAGFTDVGGSLALAGADGPVLAGSLQVRGDFRCAGDVTVTGAAGVARNAWLSGDLIALGSFTVGGVLHHQGSLHALLLSAPTQSEESVSVEKPCACAAEERLPIADLVANAASDNDNVLIHLEPETLTQATGSRTLALGCGRYYLDGIAGGELTLDVSAPAALFVNGSVELDGKLDVRLAPGAELDLFVAGELRVAGAVSLASKERPSAGRLYVAGAGEIPLTSPWIGNLYAPLARVSASSALEVWGSIFAGQFVSTASASFIFDRALSSAGSACSTPKPPAGSCSRCGWCSGGTACVEGVCAACRRDDDCCSQSVCSNGSCVALVDVR